MVGGGGDTEAGCSAKVETKKKAGFLTVSETHEAICSDPLRA